ncbi:hypothetical protein LZ012_18125 [Dechloromonas sp. XY25]|uniref:Transglutaminase-like domain-containing protein n=1 Tax=Dechloromonas hankyongensis TaxID=2908002 RepID=A0ABS9K759_9RHOO|nr:hypothetical protein [Dechloromonas hankyongensis]MCG2578915.1 hypothetical protein [Dechloromonas hankyongensis]
MLRWGWLLLAGLSGGLWADESVRVCHGYGCNFQVAVRYTEGQLGQIRRMLLAATDAATERSVLAVAIGRLYGWAGEQSDIHNDRGGNYADDNVSGKMDCIDHSTSTTRLLHLLARRGYLRWHRVLETDSRNFAGIVPVHWSAVIEEKRDDEHRRFVIDSWFVDNGQPAVILPLDEWKKGAGPDV